MYKYISILFFGGVLYLYTNPLHAQANDSNELVTTEVYVKPDVEPEFPGGQSALNVFLAKNIRYPSIARDENIQGKVYASFDVDTLGAISNIKIMRGIGYGCDEEVIRVLKLMPAWKPGMLNGRKVKVKYMVPVNFALR